MFILTVEVVRSDTCAACTVLVVMLQEASLQVQKVCRELRSTHACSTVQQAIPYSQAQDMSMATWVS